MSRWVYSLRYVGSGCPTGLVAAYPIPAMNKWLCRGLHMVWGRQMEHARRTWRTLSVFVFLAALASAAPKAPALCVSEATDAVLKMVQDPALQGEGKASERRTAMIEVVDQFFDWELMARLAMGKHWRSLGDTQRQEFVPVFKELIVSAYLGHVEGYSGEKLVYEKPSVDEAKGRAEVKALVTTDAYGEVDILYKLYRRDDSWRVRDVAVIGVSLVRNYRTQLNELMRRKDFATVMKRLHRKIEEQRKAGGVKLK